MHHGHHGTSRNLGKRREQDASHTFLIEEKQKGGGTSRNLVEQRERVERMERDGSCSKKQVETSINLDERTSRTLLEGSKLEQALKRQQKLVELASTYSAKGARWQEKQDW